MVEILGMLLRFSIICVGHWRGDPSFFVFVYMRWYLVFFVLGTGGEIWHSLRREWWRESLSLHETLILRSVTIIVIVIIRSVIIHIAVVVVITTTTPTTIIIIIITIIFIITFIILMIITMTTVIVIMIMTTTIHMLTIFIHSTGFYPNLPSDWCWRTRQTQPSQFWGKQHESTIDLTPPLCCPARTRSLFLELRTNPPGCWTVCDKWSCTRGWSSDRSSSSLTGSNYAVCQNFMLYKTSLTK